MRYVGIDAARGIALIGMLVAHAAPDTPLWRAADLAASDRSRMLFAVLAGASLAIMTAGGVREPGRRGALRRQVAVRALCVLVLGVGLVALRPPVHVILDEYGVAFALLLPALFLPRPALLALGAVGMIAAPLIVGSARAALDGAQRRDPVSAVLAEWAYAGPYPVLVWVAAMLTGMALTRGDLPRTPALAALAAGSGIVAGALALWRASVGGPEPLRDVLLAAGSALLAVAVIASAVLLLDRTGGAAARTLRALAAPLVWIGSMPLTGYVLQTLVLALWSATGRAVPGDVLILLMVLGTVAAAGLWRRFVARRGPLEAAVAWLGGRRPRRG